MSKKQENILLEAVGKAQIKWVDAFNAGNAMECAQAYEEEAVMNAKPFGSFAGRAEIQDFWTARIADGLSDIEYIDPQISPTIAH